MELKVLNMETFMRIQTLRGDALALATRQADDPPPSAADTLKDPRKLYYPRVSVRLRMSPGAVPAALGHSLTFSTTEHGVDIFVLSGPGAVTGVVTGAEPVAIGPPLKGPGWLSLETADIDSFNFAAQFTRDGAACVPGRFSRDFVLLDSVSGGPVSGDHTKNSSWHGYGRDLLAVADGTVVKIRDGVPDNPEAGKPGSDISGNYLTLDIGGSAYASYLRVMPGSFRVKEGDKVRAGDTLARVGNSGGSWAPHLHFQVTNKPELISEGIPFVFKSFEETAVCPSTKAAGFGMTLPDVLMRYFTSQTFPVSPAVIHPAPRKHENEFPENLSVITFQ
jgi:hypothetical protein